MCLKFFQANAYKNKLIRYRIKDLRDSQRVACMFIHLDDYLDLGQLRKRISAIFYLTIRSGVYTFK